MEKYKTVIVGAGPAGLRCAKILSDNNEDFVLFEKKKKFDSKICAGMWCLDERTNYMNIPRNILEKEFKSILVSTPKRSVEVKHEEPFMSTVSRKNLSDYMYREAIKSGAEIRMDSPVSHIGENYIVTRDEKIYFDNLIGADGSYSLVRRHLGLGQKIGIAIQYWIKEELDDMEVYFDSDGLGFALTWIAPHKGITSVGTGTDPSIMSSKELKKRFDKWCIERGYDIDSAEFSGGPISYDYRGHVFGNKYLIGDAGGFTSGLTGGGIYFAMASGEDVANFIIKGKNKFEFIPEILSIKRKHEIFARAYRLNKTLNKVGYNLLISLLKIGFFERKVVDLVG